MEEVFDKIKQRLEEQKMSCFLTLANKGDSEKDYAYKIVAKSLERAIEIVDEVAQKYNDGWIPCNVDMPKELGRYIVTLKDGRSLEAIYDNISKRFIMYEHEVIAWQPLPASYKKE